MFLSPLEKGRAPLLNKLESLSSKDALCQVLLKMVQWFWRRGDLNFIQLFPLGTGWRTLIYQTSIPNNEESLMQSLVVIGPMILEKKIFKFRPCIFAILVLSPFEKGWDSAFKQS